MSIAEDTLPCTSANQHTQVKCLFKQTGVRKIINNQIIVICFNVFLLPYCGSRQPTAISLSLSCSLALFVSCQRHSGLEADKQAEELRMSTIALKMHMCVRGSCDAEAGWCSPLSESLPGGTLTLTTTITHCQDSAKTASLESLICLYPPLPHLCYCLHFLSSFLSFFPPVFYFPFSLFPGVAYVVVDLT